MSVALENANDLFIPPETADKKFVVLETVVEWFVVASLVVVVAIDSLNWFIVVAIDCKASGKLLEIF